MRLGTTTAVVAIVGALTASATARSPIVAAAAVSPASAPSTTWSVDLSAGEAAGITLEAGTARLYPQQRSILARAGLEPTGRKPVPTGFLTLPPQRLAAVTDRVETTVLGDIPAGSTATVDVRGRGSSGAWGEWTPGDDLAGTAVALPEPASEVQGRLVLTGSPPANPAVRGVTLTAHTATKIRLSEDEAKAPLNFRAFATREGLAGATTANGHVITERDYFVALPSRRALSPRDSSDYSVKVCAENGRCAFAPVWDVGPWNTRDDYWNPASERQEWTDLPHGMPQAQAAHDEGYNEGLDQYDRAVANPSGIDVADGLFWDALGLTANSWVTVDYLWTGSARLAMATSNGPIRRAPDGEAEVVGSAANRSAVPVECVHESGEGKWLRIGVDQYVSADLVPDPGPIGPCSGGGADGTEPDNTEPDQAEASAEAESESGEADSAEADSGEADSAEAESEETESEETDTRAAAAG